LERGTAQGRSVLVRAASWTVGAKKRRSLGNGNGCHGNDGASDQNRRAKLIEPAHFDTLDLGARDHDSLLRLLAERPLR
jgi:mono/diheme cytochrome c family protein